MAIQVQTASGSGVALSNSVRTQYIENYLEGAMSERLYDQISMPVPGDMSQMKRGSSVQVNFLSDMDIGTSAISEVTDVTPQSLRDATASITPTSRGEALQASENLMIKAFTDYAAKFAQRVGANMMETVDTVARDAAVKGDFVLRASNTARGSLDAGTTAHRCSEADFLEAAGYIDSFRIPGFKDAVNGKSMWPAIMHTFVYHDILKEASGNVIAVAQYQNAGLYFNHEMGEAHGFRFVVSPNAKVLFGAGSNNAGNFSTTLSAAANALATSMSITSDTASVGNGAWLNIGTVDTGSTHQYNSERVKYVSRSTNTVSFIGSGANGGLRWDHASGAVVSNRDSVYTVVIGGPDSLVKVYAPEVGEYGQLVGPKKDGILDQWDTLGWKWYGGYGRFRENGLVRLEVTVSNEA